MKIGALFIIAFLLGIVNFRQEISCIHLNPTKHTYQLVDMICLEQKLISHAIEDENPAICFSPKLNIVTRANASDQVHHGDSCLRSYSQQKDIIFNCWELTTNIPKEYRYCYEMMQTIAIMTKMPDYCTYAPTYYGCITQMAKRQHNIELCAYIDKNATIENNTSGEVKSIRLLCT